MKNIDSVDLSSLALPAATVDDIMSLVGNQEALLATPAHEVPGSVFMSKCLFAADIGSIGQLIAKTEDELRKVFGKHANKIFMELHDELGALGLALAGTDGE